MILFYLRAPLLLPPSFSPPPSPSLNTVCITQKNPNVQLNSTAEKAPLIWNEAAKQYPYNFHPYLKYRIKGKARYGKCSRSVRVCRLPVFAKPSIASKDVSHVDTAAHRHVTFADFSL